MLSNPEGKTLEFKRDLSSLQPILKTLVAFANTAGGTLVIGKDDLGTIVGVDNIFEAEEKLANVISDAISPLMIPDIEIITVENRSLLLVCVTHWPGPFYLKAKGPEEGVFVRVGSTNRRAGPEWISAFKEVQSHTSFDQKPCLRASQDDLDMDAIRNLFQKADKPINQNKLLSLNILVPYGKKLIPSNGGIILFGKKAVREQLFPQTTVYCARFLGTDKVDFLDQQEMSKSIVDGMEDILAFIRRNTRMSAKIERIQREDIPEYSPIIIREVLTNALVHADYSITGMHIRVMIFSDRMEIESPGMLPLGYTLEDFTSGISRIRNKVLARTFRELKKMEEWGTGYKRITDVCKQGRYPLPKWEEIGLTLKVTLHSCPVDAVHRQASNPTSPRHKQIMELLRQESSLSAKEIHARLKSVISERTLRSDLQKLKKLKLVVSIGSGPQTHWMLKE